MSTWPFYAINFFAGVGLVATLWVCAKHISELAWAINRWSKSRAYHLVAHAIFDYEINRGVVFRHALGFGLEIMRKSEVC